MSELSKLHSSASIISTALRGEQQGYTHFRDEESEASKPVVELGFEQISLSQNRLLCHILRLAVMEYSSS